jgi:hypothetical protein
MTPWFPFPTFKKILSLLSLLSPLYCRSEASPKYMTSKLKYANVIEKTLENQRRSETSIRDRVRYSTTSSTTTFALPPAEKKEFEKLV